LKQGGDNMTFDLIIVAMYQNSPARFYHIVNLMLEQESFEFGASAAYVYYTIAMETFGSAVGGPSPRFSCTGINIDNVFFDDGVEQLGNFRFRNFRTYLYELVQWLNETPEASFNQDLWRAKVGETAEKIKHLCYCDVSEFRILLLVQICALSGVVLLPSKKLLNIIYPVKGKGSYLHLLKEVLDEDRFGEAMGRVSNEFELGKYGLNAVEALLCETRPGSRTKYDLFFREQNLYNLQEGGVAMEKVYGQLTWNPLTF
jgi:hypothetical protein